jgi:hypothetical protein
MTLRYVSCAFTAIVLSCSMLIVAPAQAQTRDDGLLPGNESALITVAGCFQLGGHDGDKFMLATPKLGPIDNVPDGTCNAPVDERAIRLKHTDQQGMNSSMLGHWVEVSGRLEKEEDTDLTNIREFYVRSFRMVPVVPPEVIPPRAEAAPSPAPPLQYEPQPVKPEEHPIGTTGTVETALPKTAGPLPLFGLLGVLSLAGGLGIRLYRSQRG